MELQKRFFKRAEEEFQNHIPTKYEVCTPKKITIPSAECIGTPYLGTLDP